jgi:predicted house-cleaning noncanonical NTP pyrophosphatase (MazG superfamily)
MPMRVIFKKLVGDKVLGRSLADPKVLEVNYRTLEGDELSRALLKKLHEEVDEIGAADSPAEALKEFADALNVLDVLRKHLGFSPEEVRQAQQKKLEKDGSLGSGAWVEHVVLADDSEWIETFRAQPDKYREEKI